MSKLNDISDKSAICLSILCVLHCIALPLMLVILPSVTALNVISDERFHLWLVCAVAPISIFALTQGFKFHRKMNIVVLNLVGILTLVSAILFGHDLFAGKGEVVLTIVGSILIVFSHFKNLHIRRIKTCKTEVRQAI